MHTDATVLSCCPLSTCCQLSGVHRASGILPKFVKFLKSSGSEQAEKQKDLESDLDELNKFLEENGPYLGGERVIAADLALSPRLYHIDVAAKALKVRLSSILLQCKRVSLPRLGHLTSMDQYRLALLAFAHH